MDKDIKLKKKRRLPYWAALLLGMVGCAIIANLFTIALQFGAFNAWATIPTPPSGSTRIVDADEMNVWVSTSDGRVFGYDIYCFGDNKCGQWLPVNNSSNIESHHVVPMQSGKQCPKSGDLFPIGPTGEVLECVLVANPGPDMGSVTYYALKSDGTLKMWRNSGSNIETSMFFFLSTIIVPILVAVIISAFYLGMRIGKKDQEKVRDQ